MNEFDLRDLIFASIADRSYNAVLVTNANGVLSGVAAAAQQAELLGLKMNWQFPEGAWLPIGTQITLLSGAPKAIALGEERLLGCLCKASGIASAARRAIQIAEGRIRVVCGAWKKLPIELKPMVKQAIASGGMPTRIVDQPFLYLDKNYVRMFGGIRQTLQAVSGLSGVKAVQVRGEQASVAEETHIACQEGADVVMVDTGREEDARAAVGVAQHYPHVRVAFAGGIKLEDIPHLADLGLHILDIGSEIVDAPLLDIRLDVTGEREARGI